MDEDDPSYETVEAHALRKAIETMPVGRETAEYVERAQAFYDFLTQRMHVVTFESDGTVIQATFERER